jgi:hypothetical protein
MSTSTVVNVRRVVVAAVAGVAAAMSVFVGSASAGSPSFLTAPGFDPAAAGAYDLYAAGLVNVAPTPSAYCNDDNPVASKTLVSLKTPVGTAKALKAKCAIGDGWATSSSTIASVNLLGGKLKVTGLSSTCTDTDGYDSDSAGIAQVGSTITTVNGAPAPKGSGSIFVPGVAAVYFNKMTDDGVTISTHAIEVVVAPVVVLGHTVTAGQVIDIGGCSITRFPPLT